MNGDAAIDAVADLRSPAMLPELPPFAARDVADLTPSTIPLPPDPIPGWIARGSLRAAQRWALRVPDAWNGRLVVAGTPAQRSEFACDRLFTDHVLARGYAYVSSNKGEGEGIALVSGEDPLELDGSPVPRFRLGGGLALAFWHHARGHLVERWLDDLLEITVAAHELLADRLDRGPAKTFGLGLSNGGYQIRRAVEQSELFDGAVTWNAVLWTPEHNVLRTVPAAVGAMDAGEPERLLELGFPPDVVASDGSGSLYKKNLDVYWRVTAWLHAMQVDPEVSIAYGDVDDPRPAEAWQLKIGSWHHERSPLIGHRVAAFANTGRLRCPLIDLASEYDHLVPPGEHFFPYADLVRAAGRADLYDGRLIPRAQHVDAWCDDPLYPAMRPGWPDVIAAFDELTTLSP